MYTELVVVADINEMYHKQLSEIFNPNFENDTSWECLSSDFDSIKSLKEFISCDRYMRIPFSECLYKLNPQFNNGLMFIWCNFKNYDNEIEKFFNLLKDISDEILCFKSRFEEDSEWRDYLNEN